MDGVTFWHFQQPLGLEFILSSSTTFDKKQKRHATKDILEHICKSQFMALF